MSDPVAKTLTENTPRYLESRGFLWFSLLVISLLCTIFALTENYKSGMLLSRDGYGYLLYTQEALESDFEHAALRYPDIKNYPPLLVIFMYGIGKLGFNYEIAARTLNFLAILFTAWGALIAARRLYQDKLMALCTALMIACIPKLYNAGCDVLRDPLYWAESMWMTVLLLQMVDPAEKWSKNKFASSIITFVLLSALSVLTRKEGLFWSLLCCGLLWGFSPFSCRQKVLITVLTATAMIVAAVLAKASGVSWDIVGSLRYSMEGL